MIKRILLVDEEPDLLFLISHGLQKRGYEVLSGRDGREALALAAELVPDLIILDIHLPLMNGDEVVALLKKDEKLKHIPVFLISSGTAGLEEKAAECGADASFHKPFDFVKLDREIKKYDGPGRPPAERGG